MKIKCLVVDDEPLALSLIAGYVEKTPFLDLVGQCSSAFQVLEILMTQAVDLLFLDIQMPGLTGLELTRAIPPSTRVVFTTAYPQFALEGFKVDALDYLVKPFNYPEFLRAATKGRQWFGLLRGGTVSGSAAEVSGNPVRSIMVRSESRLVGVDLDQVQYIESMGDYVKLFCKDASVVVTQSTLKSLADKLPASDFFRVHRSYIVNLNAVVAIERNRIVFGKVYVPISDSVKEAFFALLNQRFLM